ncbi:hypothetical protein QOZ83_08155 [Romboutsia sedimentorum]|uniref:hypothetical protein n=1 Tax=Romboutsia sedimentorum TaxID=1368474 RepID=UPI0024DEE3CF|nr:hypothetical protein [Romboutsia sedimentorum]MDK2585830.1 hypothetical protein [Romboutsia sedimentorum]
MIKNTTYKSENVREQILKLSNQNDKKICIFGAGTYGKNLYYKLNSNLVDIYCFLDNDMKKWGYMFNNVTCISSKELQMYKNDVLIIVAIQNPTEILEQLNNEGFPYVITKQIVDPLLLNPALNNLDTSLKIDYSSEKTQCLVGELNKIISDIYKYYNSKL